MDLAQWVQVQAERYGGLRALQRKTGIAVSTLSQLANGRLKGRPEMETLVRLSEGLEVPLSDLVDLVMGDLGGSDEALIARLAEEAAINPDLAEILHLLRKAAPEDRRAVLKYLRGALYSNQ